MSLVREDYTPQPVPCKVFVVLFIIFDGVWGEGGVITNGPFSIFNNDNVNFAVLGAVGLQAPVRPLEGMQKGRAVSLVSVGDLCYPFEHIAFNNDNVNVLVTVGLQSCLLQGIYF